MTDKSVLQLQQPLKDGGIRNVNFFNGRLLSGKDLSSEQAARREADARLGRALGDGVAEGLDVARDTDLDLPQAPVLRIRAGLALNRRGQALRLLGDTSVALTRSFDADAADCVFASCAPLAGGTYVAGAGVYLLTIAPAQLNDGRAASSGLDPASVACNTDAVVEAVQFRLIAVNRSRHAGLDPASRQFRNRLAYLCFGVDARTASAADPWRADPPRYGLVDELREVGLDDRDVPLALLSWTSDGLQFVDMWAVRRALLEPDARTDLAFIARRRRLSEAHAMCAQFQQHLIELLAATTNPATVVAADHFRWLPPFGLVPLARAPLRGFAEPAFFSGLVRRPATGSNQRTPFIDVRLLGTLQQQALEAPPIDVASGEFIWLHRPWQNVKALADGSVVQPVVAFAAGLLPPPAVARFDMARFDGSDYAACCGGS